MVTKDKVKEAAGIDPGGRLSALEEEQLFAHYGVSGRSGRLHWSHRGRLKWPHAVPLGVTKAKPLVRSAPTAAGVCWRPVSAPAEQALMCLEHRFFRRGSAPLSLRWFAWDRVKGNGEVLATTAWSAGTGSQTRSCAGSACVPHQQSCALLRDASRLLDCTETTEKVRCLAGAFRPT